MSGTLIPVPRRGLFYEGVFEKLSGMKAMRTRALTVAHSDKDLGANA